MLSRAGRTTDRGFVFGTKAETLARLKPLLSSACLVDQEVFEVREWHDQRAAITSRVLKRFGDQVLIVRSSSKQEDGEDFSMAGAYLSVAGVEPFAEAFATAVDRVVESYGSHQDDSQVLVQPMIQNVVISGVVLTRDLDTGSPYYVINYDDMTGRTDSVTSGAESKTILVHRSRLDALRSARFRELIRIVAEVEAETGSRELDIEFCITSEQKHYILQVRRLAGQRHRHSIPDLRFDATLDRVRGELTSLMVRQPGLAGPTTIFGEMPDWNPAEMIGNAPKPLALSLYRYLITDATWVRARVAMGYRRIEDQPLLVDFAGRPYIDVRRSLNSFLPNGLEWETAEDLISYQLSLLTEHPEFHDKIEFKVAVTCRDLNFESETGRFRSAGLSRARTNEFGDLLGAQTLRCLQCYPSGFEELMDWTTRLGAERVATAGLPPLERARRLFDHAIPNGTMPFSQLARHAFIGISFLRSAIARGALDQVDVDHFMRGIRTVAADLVSDMHLLAEDELERDTFLARYGHLRPGTYDILSWRYDERPDLYLGKTLAPKLSARPFELSESQRGHLGALLEEAGYPVSPEHLLGYISTAVRLREAAKFAFTRNISDGLRALCEWGDDLGFDREALSFLTWSQIHRIDEPSRLKDEIAAAREGYLVTRAIRLPHLIMAPSDIDVVRMPLGHPNFITSTSVTGPVKLLKTNEVPDIDGHIVLTESADPGFDWIFLHAITGLVTKYGGANSHMTIRCAEFGLPAAIGCGERLFDMLSKAKVVELNCAARTLKVVNY